MKTMTVLGRKVKVKIVDAKVIQEETDDPYCVALYLPYTMTILISKNLDAYWRRYYLFHELTHHMMFITGIEQTLHNSLIEVICQSNAALIDDIMKNK
jgi:Zn-dependent peptidase ImmA (M78 family)